MAAAVVGLVVLAIVDLTIPRVEIAPMVTIPLLVFAYRSGLRLALIAAVIVAIAFAYIEYGPPAAGADGLQSLPLNAVVMALGFCSVVMAATFLQREMSERAALQVDLDAVLREEQRARALARTDTLSGLLNRRGLHEEIERLGPSCRSGERSLVVLVVDLDGLKVINDTYGHSFGDAAIRSAARRIRASVREHDLVARTGGDEFVVVCSGAPGAEVPTLRVLDDVRGAFRLPMRHGGVEIQLAASIGSANSGEDGIDVDELFRLADVRMYGDKARGKGRTT